MDTAERFEISGLFTRLLQQCTAVISAWLRGGTDGANVTGGVSGIEKTVWADMWRRELERARVENDTYNISPPLVLAKLFEAVKTGMICGT
jgi:hypothetical protein